MNNPAKFLYGDWEGERMPEYKLIQKARATIKKKLRLGERIRAYGKLFPWTVARVTGSPGLSGWFAVHLFQPDGSLNRYMYRIHMPSGEVIKENPGAAWHATRKAIIEMASETSRSRTPEKRAYFQGGYKEADLSYAESRFRGMENPGESWHKKAYKETIAAKALSKGDPLRREPYWRGYDEGRVTEAYRQLVANKRISYGDVTKAEQEIERDLKGGKVILTPTGIKGISNPRPPAAWFAEMLAKAKASRPRFGTERLQRYTAGIWWKLPSATRRAILARYEGATANPGAAWHEEKAEKFAKAQEQTETGGPGYYFFRGAIVAHKNSALRSEDMGLANPFAPTPKPTSRDWGYCPRHQVRVPVPKGAKAVQCPLGHQLHVVV